MIRNVGLEVILTRLSGVYTVLPTPFDESGVVVATLDRAMLDALDRIRKWFALD